ncbi:MAG: zipA [Gammaproteobacteria bacterium]|nr:zipA [Gammaproteobacteria bacterium]
MNDLRLILLGVGVLVIAGIYLWGTIKQKRDIRSKIENYPSFNHDGIANLKIKPGVNLNEDFSVAIAKLISFLHQSRQDVKTDVPELHHVDRVSVPEDISKEQIIALYITAYPHQSFSGPDILQAIESAGMHFGAMNIFHHYGVNQTHSKQVLFSLANMLEPGHFDLDTMDVFTTTGLAMFMCLPAELEGTAAFDLLLGTAQALADSLSGEVRDAEHKLLNPASIKKMRDHASLY